MDKISIIIPTKDRFQSLLRCLCSLKDVKADRAEVIIVDNSTNQLHKKDINFLINQYKKINLRYYCVLVRGASHARNYGVRKAKYNYLAFVDDDCTVDKSWFKEINRIKKGVDDVVVYGKALNGMTNNIYSEVDFALTKSFFESKRYHKGRIIYSYIIDAKNLFLSKKLLTTNQIYFDESIEAVEDLDFSYQLYLKGIKMIYNPHMIVRHCSSLNIFRLISKCFFRISGYYKFKTKWASLDYETKPM